VAIISNAVTIADAGAFSVNLGAMVHIKTLTASSSATLTFVHGADSVVFDSTYPIYKFEFIGLHPVEASGNLSVAFRDGSTAYDAPMTTVYLKNRHTASGTELAAQTYDTGNDLANATGFTILNESTGNDDTKNISGSLHIFNPSSTTFTKNFATDVHSIATDRSISDHIITSGYINVTAAVDAVQFKFHNGAIQTGKIKLYGIKDS
jgi:hypothetical protein